MPHKDKHGKRYTRRVNSNGEDVYPRSAPLNTKCRSNKGTYQVLIYLTISRKERKRPAPFTSKGVM